MRAIQTLVAALLISLLAACHESPAPSGETPPLQSLSHPSFHRLAEVDRDYLEAERNRLESELNGAPTSAAAAGQLGGFYLAHGFDEAAADAFDRASQLDANSFRWAYLHGVSLQRALRLTEARASLKRALEIQPVDPPGLLRSARIALELGELEAAEQYYHRAFEAAPGAAAASFGLGIIALEQGNPEAAVEALERALTLDPEATAIHAPLARALNSLDATDRARQHLTKVGKPRPHFEDPLFDELGSLIAGPTIHLAQGDRAMVSGRIENAIAHYRRAVELAPNNARAPP